MLREIISNFVFLFNPIFLSYEGLNFKTMEDFGPPEYIRIFSCQPRIEIFQNYNYRSLQNLNAVPYDMPHGILEDIKWRHKIWILEIDIENICINLKYWFIHISKSSSKFNLILMRSHFLELCFACKMLYFVLVSLNWCYPGQVNKMIKWLQRVIWICLNISHINVIYRWINEIAIVT